MYNPTTLKKAVLENEAIFAELYDKDNVGAQQERYIKAIDRFVEIYGEKEEMYIFSAPGRTEISGNHTDHNHGCVMAGSVNLDVIAIAAPTKDGIIRVQSEGYRMDLIDTRELEVKAKETNKSISLIRGTANRFKELGLNIGGFDAYTITNVLKGSGLSSSAAFEVLIGTILNGIYNDGSISPVLIAQIAQYAENVYFGKPCGLMDQMASSVGGIISIDFKDNDNPIITKVDFDFTSAGHALCILDTGGNHADLTSEYASIPAEMKAIAAHFGKKVLREVSLEEIMAAVSELRKKFGDRAVLRALHFQNENIRVGQQVKALTEGNFDAFLNLSVESGLSSYRYLQNVYANIAPKEQGISLALFVAESILKGRGAHRVHGGGFGGTTQNFVPLDMVEEFKAKTEAVFGEGKCHILNIRPKGGIKVF